MDDNAACGKCAHIYYDHVTHRAEGDTRTHCRIVRCDCEAFGAAASVRMADEGYVEYLAEPVRFIVAPNHIAIKAFKGYVWRK
jgi:hypothetical protein